MKIKKKEFEQDFELNIASIIDCFTVLITFLLVSASFISIALLDVSMVTASPSRPNETVAPQPPDEQLEIKLGLHEGAVIWVVHTGPGTPEILKNEFIFSNKESDWLKIQSEFSEIKKKYTRLNKVILSAEKETEYKVLIKWIEMLRIQMGWNVYLSDPLKKEG